MSLDRYEKAFIIAAIQIKVDAVKKEAAACEIETQIIAYLPILIYNVKYHI